jgi:predicted nuclease of restriction endonuclease-like (RecB) superfamily
MAELTLSEYQNWLTELKAKIRATQLRAALAVNHELLALYWELGKTISTKLSLENWGASVVEKAAQDLQKAFPDQKGFSRSNLFSMLKWYEFYSSSSLDSEKVQQLVGQIPWGHNVLIITKSKKVEEALFYCAKTLENGWSRAVLTHQIELGLYERTGKAITNFGSTLSESYSELATETLKDPYKFDFLMLQEKAVEKDIEQQLVENITAFLLELGSGFSFVGRQVLVKVDDQDFYVDLLFYHIKLKCYVVIELKTIAFKAEFAGKMNLYLSAVDDTYKEDSDNPTIGILLCKSKSKIVAEYALRGTSQPIGIAAYDLSRAIPAELQSSLPTIENIEKELSK